MDVTSASIDHLRACYHAFLQRRLQRGAASVRTRQGFEKLRVKYQPRIQFLEEASSDNPASDGDGEERSAEEVQGVAHMESDGGVEEAKEETEEDDVESMEEDGLRQLVGVYFDPRVQQVIHDQCWPLAHQGGRTGASAEKPLPKVPEWQELEKERYFAFMFNTLMWLFPGLPGFEAQAHATSDWSKDCEFDAYGSHGLSFEGFVTSLIDLATACTDGTIPKCLEFLNHMARRLETTLPLFRESTRNALHNGEEEEEADSPPTRQYIEPIIWHNVPLGQLVPTQVRPRPQYYELKSKLSSAPFVIMILAGDEKALELQLSTSAKMLIRERDDRSSVRRNSMSRRATSHFIEIEKQFLWTFRSLVARPSLIMLPNTVVSRRTLSFYASCRLLEYHERVDTVPPDSAASLDTTTLPLLTFFTSTNDPFPLLYGADKSLCGRVDRHTGRIFVVNHSERQARRFKIVLKTSLIHNTASAGGAGAATVVTAVSHLDSQGTAQCTSVDGCSGISHQNNQLPPHSFVFVVRESITPVSHGSTRSKMPDSSLPPQWYTTLSGANENKTIFVDTSEGCGDNEDPSVAGRYSVYIFSLHGFYFEATYVDAEEIEFPDLTTARRVDTAIQQPVGSFRGVHPPSSSGWYHLEPSGNDADVIPSVSSPSIRSVTSSATLLRHLLLLRRQRAKENQAQPPPDFVGGNKITNVKVITTAASLRAKFLQARATERRTRYVQKEESFRNRVLAKLVQARRKKRDDLYSHGGDHESTHADASNRSPDLDQKAQLLSAFFREMEMYHPTQQELEQVAREDESQAEQEESLLESFADLFDDDDALQNILDAEKWLSPEEKAQQRKDMVETRINQRRHSLLASGKVQVPELNIEHDVEENAQEARPQVSVASRKRASEDYTYTAQLIQRLTEEIAEEERSGVELSTSGPKPIDVEGTYMEQMTNSWIYSQRRGLRSSGVRRPTTSRTTHDVAKDVDISDLEALEGSQRDEWMQSRFIRELGVVETQQKTGASMRSPILPTMQVINDQEMEMPWRAMWEVALPDGRGDENQQQDSIVRPRPPDRSRPRTASTALCSPTEDSKEVLAASLAAKHSASFAFRRTRRIRSAHAGVAPRIRDYGLNDDSGTCHSTLNASNTTKTSTPMVQHIPIAFQGEPYSALLDTLEPEQDDDKDATDEVITQKMEQCSIALRVDKVKPTGNEHYQLSTDVECDPPKESKQVRRKQPKKSKEEKRFMKRVEELLAISPLVQDFELYQSSVPVRSRKKP